MAGKFNWLSKLGATDQAIAIFNTQPSLFATLILVLASLLAQIVLLLYIHRATKKLQEQAERNARDDDAKDESDYLGPSSSASRAPPPPPSRPPRKARSSRL
ncbi:hypothetical protein ESCO_001908 [Escovopsis weberi]|uniref:Uncharacterized protein n=1 Tax=Escovopsis weberi TaxID=150374 RepID=A0A0M8N8E2_ESCWE|nr:hypothetical protein ESCO_001908 [Escovopsis weberi]